MIVRTVMVVDMGDGNKEYVDSKVYNAIMHEGYVQGRAEAIDECKRAIVNTKSKVVNPVLYKTWDILDALANRQFEILDILEQLKEQREEK